MSPENSGQLVDTTLLEDIAVLRFPSKMFQKAETEELQAVLEKLWEQGVTSFVFDLSGCQYVSSEGLGTTARYWKLCHSQPKGRMAVVIGETTDPEVRNLFEIIGLASVIGSAIQPTVEDAVKYLKAFS